MSDVGVVGGSDTSAVSYDDELKQRIKDTENQIESAKDAAQKRLDDFNKAHGTHFKTIEEVGVRYHNDFDVVMGRLYQARQALAVLQQESEALAQLKQAIDSGDIEGALLLIQTKRVDALDQQMKARMADMSKINDDMTKQNAIIADPKASKDDKDKAQAQLNILNNTSQLAMINMQQVVNKRNEAFDLLTNTLGKFQKTLDGIVGNLH